MSEQVFNQPWMGWNNNYQPARAAPLKLNTVSSFEQVKEDQIPPNSMKEYFREDEDIVYIKITDSMGKVTNRGFHMTEFDIDQEEALNGTVTEGRLNEAMSGLESRLTDTITNMFGELKEELSRGKQSVRTENAANSESRSAKRQ